MMQHIPLIVGLITAYIVRDDNLLLLCTLCVTVVWHIWITRSKKGSKGDDELDKAYDAHAQSSKRVNVATDTTPISPNWSLKLNHLTASELVNSFDYPVLIVSDECQVWAFNDRAKDAFKGLAVGEYLQRWLRSPDVVSVIAYGLGRVVQPLGEEVQNEPSFELESEIVVQSIDAEMRVVSIFQSWAERDRAQLSFEIDSLKHEIKTALSVAKARFELFEMAYDKSLSDKSQSKDPKMVEHLHELKEALERIADLFKVEETGALRNIGKANLTGAQVLDILASTAAEYTETGMVIEIDGRAGAGSGVGSILDSFKVIYSRESLLKLILHNLFENAQKYGATKVEVTLATESALKPAPVVSPPMGNLPNASHIAVDTTVEPAASKPTEVISISVADNGDGINRLEQDRIFIKGYRTPAARSGANPGLGLGLYLARHAAHITGGRLELQHSTPSEGSVFCVEFPAETNPSSQS